MPRFIKLEDNEDGTMMMTTNIYNGEEMQILVEALFDDFMALMVDPEVLELGKDLVHDATLIPNSLEES